MTLPISQEPIVLMRFTLSYDGELPAAGNSSKKAKEKCEIRNAIHPQLKELWETNPVLKRLPEVTRIQIGSAYHPQEVHHSAPHPGKGITAWDTSTNLIEPIDLDGRKYIPLVRESMALGCSLSVLFLRKEERGK